MALPNAMVPKAILEEFQTHCTSLRHAYNARKEAVVLKNVVEDRQDREAIAVEDTLGRRQPTDKYEGDVNLRTLRLLLKMIDERGWERYVMPLPLPLPCAFPMLSLPYHSLPRPVCCFSQF